MFLIYIQEQQNKIESILSIIEKNSVLVGIIVSIITGSLWFRKYIKQKRAEAFFGFYAKLSLRLKSLQERLEENGQLNISDYNAGNIYSLIYDDKSMKTFCPSYKKPDENKLKLYMEAAKELKDILINTENNVYPPGTKRKEWYENQHIIYSFCEFIENDAYQHITNKEYIDDKNIPIHIMKCKLFINAINNIQKSICNAKY